MQISENTSLKNLTVADLKLLVSDLVTQILAEKELLTKDSAPKLLTKSEKPISEIASELAAVLTDEDWEDLPANASKLVDQYVYGIPEKEE
ncbi:MAG: hypothetical protein SAJ37_07770 [Oscillatoria sp. PMC 1068.18]|nr:hypothetical protein [Oscillatoria sp. PMC 1076.18]MEC4988631.1 hypothetical protein [Oscillatoria sp. PMC 1068.18]